MSACHVWAAETVGRRSAPTRKRPANPTRACRMDISQQLVRGRPLRQQWRNRAGMIDGRYTIRTLLWTRSRRIARALFGWPTLRRICCAVAICTKGGRVTRCTRRQSLSVPHLAETQCRTPRANQIRSSSIFSLHWLVAIRSIANCDAEAWAPYTSRAKCNSIVWSQSSCCPLSWPFRAHFAIAFCARRSLRRVLWRDSGSQSRGSRAQIGSVVWRRVRGWRC